MEVQYPTFDEPATSEYVLSVFRSAHRQEFASTAGVDEELVELTFDTSVSEWIDAFEFDLMSDSEIGRMLNRWWEIECTAAEWERVLKPGGERQLGDVCDLIASRAVRPRMQAANIFGSRCLEAGAFLTVRSLLAKDGAEVAGLTPSTPLRPYLEKHGSVFCSAVARLNPDRVPPLVFRRPICDAAGWTMVAGWLTGIGGWLGGWPIVEVAGFTVKLIAHATHSFAVRCLPPASVEFGSLLTFRELSVALARAE